MDQIVRHHRNALLALLRTEWTEFWVVAPRISYEAAALLVPFLNRPDATVRVLTNLDRLSVADGSLDPNGIAPLLGLENCEIRELNDMKGALYAAGPRGPALVTGVSLTLESLDADHACGVLVADASAVLGRAEEWWAAARPLDEALWHELMRKSERRLRSSTLGDEIARVGAFVRIRVHGTRRSRRLDPREFGVPEGEWGRSVRPVEVALFKLDEVIRAREELEAILADRGVEWNGHYLVPRQFLERDWPRLFAARERQLKERLRSEEGRAGLKSQLAQARRDLEAFLADLYPRARTDGLPAAVWIDQQATRVLAEAVSETVLSESSLEYRVLTILPEDARSVEELSDLLLDPKLRSVQLTFHF